MKFSQFDAAEYLEDEETIAFYLNDALESGDTQQLLQALQTVAKARGMSQLAKDTGLGRESLYKTLSGKTKPRFETIYKISKAMGVDIQFKPISN